jgi:glutaredoxin
MKKFAVLLIAVGALYFFKPGLFPSFGKKGAFDAKGNAQTLLFTQAGCGAFCDKAVQELKDRGVAFEEVKLDGDDTVKRYRDLGGDGRIPMLAVGREMVAGYDKGAYASALAQNFGDSALTRAELLFYKNHFDADGKPLVFMYGATWCGYCKELRAEMESRKIAFQEFDVDTDPDKALIIDAMDLSAYPITYVGYKRIVGASKTDEVLKALKTAGSHKI